MILRLLKGWPASISGLSTGITIDLSTEIFGIYENKYCAKFVLINVRLNLHVTLKAGSTQQYLSQFMSANGTYTKKIIELSGKLIQTFSPRPPRERRGLTPPTEFLIPQKWGKSPFFRFLYNIFPRVVGEHLSLGRPGIIKFTQTRWPLIYVPCRIYAAMCRVLF